MVFQDSCPLTQKAEVGQAYRHSRLFVRGWRRGWGWKRKEKRRRHEKKRKVMPMKGHAVPWEEHKHYTLRSCYWCELNRLIHQSLSGPVSFGITNLHPNQLKTQLFITNQRSVLHLNWLQGHSFYCIEPVSRKICKGEWHNCKNFSDHVSWLFSCFLLCKYWCVCVCVFELFNQIHKYWMWIFSSLEM